MPKEPGQHQFVNTAPAIPSMTRRPIAILVVAFRALDMLKVCLTSIATFLPECKVHVWDNSGSDFPDVRDFAYQHPEIEWHLGGKNIGFAAAVNRLAESVPGHDLLLVNPDAELIGPLKLTLAGIREPKIAAASPLEGAFPGEVKVDSGGRRIYRRRAPWDVAYRKLTLCNLFGNAAGLGDRFPGSPFSLMYRSQPSEVDGFLAGSCLAINREAWDTVGPFDEEFFLYHEESEWQRRATSAGWKLRLADEVGVRHYRKGTVASDPRRLMRSQDLAFASSVLMAEYCFGLRVGELFLVFATVIDNLKARIRRRPAPAPRPREVVLTANGSAATVSQRSVAALALIEAGYPVSVICLQRVGASLPSELPATVRLVRRPWWWPSIAPCAAPSFFVIGTTARERAFARLFRLRHPGVPLVSINELRRLAEAGAAPCASIPTDTSAATPG